MNICLGGWFSNIEHKNKTSKSYFEFGAHVFCVHLYNLAIKAIEEKNIYALEFLAKIDAIVFLAGKEEQSLFGEDIVQKVMNKYPQGVFKISIPVEYLNKDVLTEHHILFKKKEGE